MSEKKQREYLREYSEALAATDGLSGYILCEREPVAIVLHEASKDNAILLQNVDDKTPLYRAREEQK